MQTSFNKNYKTITSTGNQINAVRSCKAPQDFNEYKQIIYTSKKNKYSVLPTYLQ